MQRQHSEPARYSSLVVRGYILLAVVTGAAHLKDRARCLQAIRMNVWWCVGTAWPSWCIFTVGRGAYLRGVLAYVFRVCSF